LIAFGGAGPLHAARLAAAMDIDEVHVPLHGGVFSSVGLLLADLRIDTLRSVARLTTDLDTDQICDEFERLEQDARAQLAAQGVDERSVVCERLADVRYSFQVGTETIELDAEELRRDVAKCVAERFSGHFEKRYGYTAPDPIVLVNIRVRATAAAGRLDLRSLADRTGLSKAEQQGSRRAYFGRPARIETVTYPVGLLPEDCVGPAIIELPDTTIVVPPGWSASRREDIGSYALRRGALPETTEES
jgi:N-methylhydantoinase A